jgi:hypothetical protein
VPYNLLQQSNSFDTTWLSNGTTETSGQSGYDGTNNAWLLKKNTSGSRYIEQSLSLSSAQYSCSVYLKAESTNWVLIWSYDGSTGVQAYFDLENGVVGDAGGSNLDSTNIESVGNGWYRCTLTYTRPTTLVRIYPADANGSVSPTDDNGIYIQDAQLNSGATAKPYFPTTTRLNVPRVDYLNNPNGSLKLEPQRTNLATYSSEFDNAAWEYGGITKTANAAISPDGTSNADRIEITTLATPNLRQSILVTQSTNYTFSFYAKSSELSVLKLAVYNLNGAAFIFENTEKPINDEWSRVTVSFATPSGCSSIRVFIFRNSDALGSFYVWGAQLEQGSYATSIINTAGATVTRLADASATTGLSDVIGQTEGTMFIDFVWKGLSSVVTDNSIFSLGNQEYGNSSIAISNYNGTLYGRITNGTSVDASVNYGAMTSGTRYKCAIGYANNDFVFYVNGVQIGSDTSVSIPARSDVYLQNAHPNSKSVNQAQLYKTRLTNAELITLTTL